VPKKWKIKAISAKICPKVNKDESLF